MSIHECAGVWVTLDGDIRRAMSTDGHFEETRVGMPDLRGRYERAGDVISFQGEFASFDAIIVSDDEMQSECKTLYRLKASPTLGDG